MNGAQKTVKVLAICLAVFIIFNIIRGIIFGLSFFSKITGNSDNKVSVTNFSETYKEVEKIHIETVTSDIIIKYGSEFRVEASNLKNDFSSKVRNGTLKIEETKLWFKSNSMAGKITIYVPEKINDLKIDSGAGKIEILDIEVNNFNIDQGAGKLTIENSSFMSSDIDGGAGEVKIVSSKLNNLKLDAGVGKIDLEGEITGNSKIECGIGKMDINLLGNKDDYSIVSERGIGTIKINGKEQASYGDGINRIKLEGGIGEINVEFREEKVKNNKNNIENSNENYITGNEVYL